MSSLHLMTERIRYFDLIVLLAAVLLTALPRPALAHPLGNFTINRYSRVEVGTDRISLVYVLDMAEIPTQQERPLIDSDGDGLFSLEEQGAYLRTLIPDLQQNLDLELNGQSQPWRLETHELSFPAGQAGLPTMRMRAQFVSKLALENEKWRATYRDRNYAGRLGWQEVVVQAAAGIDLLSSTAPSADLSHELVEYPDDLLSSPPSVNQADFQFQLAGSNSSSQLWAPIVQPAAVDARSLVDRSSEPFAELIHLPALGPWTFFVALLAAFGWGAAHALSPGHGKTIVGAYLVGAQGTAKHALFLGLTTTVTHTAGVFALGLLTLFASRYILPETIYPWLSLLSGLLVLFIGFSMAWSWLRRTLAEPVQSHQHHHENHHHNYDHEHEHNHHHLYSNGDLHSHDGVHFHRHHVPGQDGTPVTWRSLLALGVSGGLLPCPSALVVMLGAIALGRIGFGLVLIMAFSLGLAGVLTAFGLLLVFAGKFFARLPESGRFLKLMPVGSSLFITLIGAGITWRALAGLL